MQIKINDVSKLEPNYIITIATMDELCSWFRQYTWSWAKIEDIRKSFEMRQKKGIRDDWMKRWMEAVKMYGPASKTARVISVHNLVPLIWRTEFAKALLGETSNIVANYIAVGSGWNVPASTDTQLQTEFVRWTFNDTYYTDNVAYLDKFFWSAEVWNTTILECWIFMGWTATVNSWTLLSRVNFNETTTANETVTINVSITFTSAT